MSTSVTSWAGTLMQIVGVALLIAVALAVFFLLRRILRERMPTTQGTCGRCGYSVEGLTGFTCPECGADLRTVGIIPGRKAPEMRSALLAVLITAGVAMMCCFGLMLARVGPSRPAPVAIPAPPPRGPLAQPSPTQPSTPPDTQPLPDVE